MLSDTIRLNNHMVISSMSSNEYNAKCISLSTDCTNTGRLGKDCHAHISKKNLEKISTNLKLILKQSEEITADRESKKKLHLGNYGYLNVAIHYPEI